MSDVNLIKIDGKPIEKLIEVISDGIGTLYRPRAIRKEAEAIAYKIRVIGKAESEALAESRLIEAENLERINERLIAKERDRQNNIDDVVEIAVKEFDQNTIVSGEGVNKDWATRFFNIVQDVSDDEMKKLWGRILAGEVKSPKSYSLRTLELLRNFSKEDADLFVKVAPFILHETQYFLFKGKNGNLNKYGISITEIMKLTEIGLLQANSEINKIWYTLPNMDTRSIILSSNKTAIVITIKKNTENVSIPTLLLTRTAEELYNLIEITRDNRSYLKDLADTIRDVNITIEYANISQIKQDGSIEFFPPLLML